MDAVFGTILAVKKVHNTDHCLILDGVLQVPDVKHGLFSPIKAKENIELVLVYPLNEICGIASLFGAY